MDAPDCEPSPGTRIRVRLVWALGLCCASSRGITNASPVYQILGNLVCTPTTLRRHWTSPSSRTSPDILWLLPLELMTKLPVEIGSMSKFELASRILRGPTRDTQIALELRLPLCEIGNCRLSPCVGSGVAGRLFEMWNTATDRRIAKKQWALETRNVGCEESFGAASRDVTKARGRMP